MKIAGMIDEFECYPHTSTVSEEEVLVVWE